MAKKINRKTKSYFVKKNSRVILLDNDVNNPTKDPPRPVDLFVTEKIFGYDRSFLVTEIKIPYANRLEKFYLFRHISGFLMAVNERDIIKTSLTVPRWCKKNKKLMADIATETYLEVRP